MEVSKLKLEDMVSFDLARLTEVETMIRKEKSLLNMDVYAEKGKNTGKKRALKKALATLLTIKNERIRQRETRS